MPKEKKLPMSVQQSKDRPKIEDLILEYLPDEKNFALDFAKCLRDNKMNPGRAG